MARNRRYYSTTLELSLFDCETFGKYRVLQSLQDSRMGCLLPIALPGPGELEGKGERPRAASPDPGRAVGNPIDCPVNSEAPGTPILKDSRKKTGVVNLRSSLTILLTTLSS